MKELYILMAFLNVILMVSIVPMAVVLVVVCGKSMPMESNVCTLLYSVILIRIFRSMARFFIDLTK